MAVVLSTSSVTAGTHRVSASFITEKAPDEVLDVLLAYDKTCERGCRYYRDDLVLSKKLAYRARATHWYTWTHLSTPLREVKYFASVVLRRGAAGAFDLESRQLGDADAELIGILETETGLAHSPAFDRGHTHTFVEPIGNGKTKVGQTVTLVSSGVLSLWKKKIEKEIREDITTTFDNIDS